MRLIDADALHNSLRNNQKWVVRSFYGEKINEGYTYDQVHFAIDDAPTVDAVERKRGRWIPIVKGERGYSAGDFRCSVCGDPCKCYHLTNYCPNCGAEMEQC